MDSWTLYLPKDIILLIKRDGTPYNRQKWLMVPVMYRSLFSLR